MKNKILNLLKNNKDTTSYLKTIQDKLMKNYSNPVFNEKSKNKLLKLYSNVENLGKSLYRYNMLKQNNIENPEDISNIVLKCGISNTKYIWRSENGEHTCSECLALDGTEYDLEDDIPDRPHLNCKCYVEIVEDEEDDDENSQHPKWIMPCNGPIVGEYGEPRETHVHNGIDIAVPVGTPIKAIADGTVVVVGPTVGYGYWVGINHGLVNGIKISSEYGHISRWIVNYGQKVKQGQIIAYSGNTGYSKGPHLHLTIRQGNPGKGGGIAVNPWDYIDRAKY